MSGPTIRRATDDDLGPAVHVYLASRKAAHAAGHLPPIAHPDDDVRGFFGEVVWRDQEVWVAEVDGAIAGLLVLDGEQVDHLYLPPERQRQGIGTALVEHAKAVRPAGLELWAFVSNTPARAFYERHGFVEQYRTDGSTNEERSPDIRFRWDPAP